MEGNLPSGSMIPGVSYGMLDQQNSIQTNHPQHPHLPFHHHNHQNPNNPQHHGLSMHPPMHSVFPLPLNQVSDCDHSRTCRERGKTPTAEEDDLSFNTEDGANGHNESKGKQGWHRMKWTDGMVRLLITAVSYLSEEAECLSGNKRKFAILQKKGKWKSISKVLAERGCYVSPQQCEDKFNDLNKRYKRLTDILGRGTSCKVVENPALLDMMGHLSDKAKDDVRKILSSKHLFYEEMCSYHNCNRLNLPADPSLQQSLQLALRSKDEDDTKRVRQDDHDEEEEEDDDDGEEEEEEDDDDDENISSHKHLKLGMNNELTGFGNQLRPQSIPVDMNQVFPEGSKADFVQKQFMRSRKLQLEEARLRIHAEMLQLKRSRFKWIRFSKKKERELEKMRMENKRMKLENEQLELELKRKELEIDANRNQ